MTSLTATTTSSVHQSSSGQSGPSQSGQSGPSQSSSGQTLTSGQKTTNESIDILELLLNDSVQSNHSKSHSTLQSQSQPTIDTNTTIDNTNVNTSSSSNMVHNNPFAAAVHAQLEVQKQASQGGGVDHTTTSTATTATSATAKLMLPSEPQVMRTKRLGHRKASSVSYLLPASSPTTAAHTSQQQQQMHSLSSAHSNYSTYHQQQAVAFAQSANQSAASYTPSHNRANSLTGIQDLNPDSVTDFLSFAQTSYPQSASNSPPDSASVLGGMDHHLQQQQFNQQQQHHVNGHRRFHSMGNIVGMCLNLELL